MTVRRFALGSSASLTISGSEISKYCRFQDSGTDAAIGFEQEVDGIALECTIGADTLDEVLEGEGLKTCRVPYFLSRVEGDPDLRRTANSFQLGWIGQIYLSLVTSRMCLDDLSVEGGRSAVAYYEPDAIIAHVALDHAVRSALPLAEPLGKVALQSVDGMRLRDPQSRAGLLRAPEIDERVGLADRPFGVVVLHGITVVQPHLDCDVVGGGLGIVVDGDTLRFGFVKQASRSM